MVKNVSLKIQDKEITIETGKLAKQAGGSVLVRMGDSIVLTSVTASKEPMERMDYFPLQVIYLARSYSAGKIPGGFIKREGRPSEKEILTSRLVDRPIRPLFPKGFRNEVQVVPMTVSMDRENQPDVLAIIGASAALSISNIPFNGPIGAVRVGKIDDKFIINPTFQETEESSIDIIVAGTKNGILMVEGSSSQVSETEMVEALKSAHKHIIEIVKIQEELVNQVGKPEKMEPELSVVDENLEKEVTAKTKESLNGILTSTTDKQERGSKIDELFKTVLAEMTEKFSEEIEENDIKKQIGEIFEDIESDIVRSMILEKGKRIDGRNTTDIREITCEVGILPRTHGSALFTRGQTQSLGVITLGSVNDEQRLDNIEGEDREKFMLHYNFPPYSVGETGRVGFTSRREVGHGTLAKRSLREMLPEYDEFPYTIRIVSEILESNGSSSMATVCSGTLAMLDAGVPLKDSVAGVAMGLVMKDDKNFAVLTDILGEEDHLGDMDFKVAGTEKGITAFQMDIKVDSITFDIMEKALAQAKEGRLFILKKMKEVMPEKREKLSPYAPKIEILKIPKDKIALVIGPGGSTIKDIIAKTETDINVNDEGDEGTVSIAGVDQELLDKAVEIIKNITKEVKAGEVYEGEVRKVADFGAFVALPGKKDGLVHISEISSQRTNKVSDVLKEGQVVKVKILEIKRDGKISLTMKDADK